MGALPQFPSIRLTSMRPNNRFEPQNNAPLKSHRVMTFIKQIYDLLEAPPPFYGLFDCLRIDLCSGQFDSAIAHPQTHPVAHRGATRWGTLVWISILLFGVYVLRGVSRYGYGFFFPRHGVPRDARLDDAGVRASAKFVPQLFLIGNAPAI